ncbi:MAG: hypothetical protein O3A96_01395 [Proteobacteria bacterium]|nr:hypothetical protein [Pseudomonadota bacterium]
MQIEIPVLIHRKCKRCSSVKRDPIYPARCSACGAPVHAPTRIRVSGSLIVFVTTIAILSAIVAITV